MKAIKVQLEINRVTIKKDDSLSFSANTPELTDEELGAFRNLSKTLVNALLESSEGSTGLMEINEKIEDGKSPSSRLRAVLFILWEQKGKPYNDFELYYRSQMENIINAIKGKLE